MHAKPLFPPIVSFPTLALLLAFAFAPLPSLSAAERHVFIGTQYLRPPNPREADWDRDLAHIRETGLPVVRTWVTWARVNPSPGIWDFSEYDRFFDVAERHGLKVFVQLMSDVAPFWFESAHPETRLIDRNGAPIEFFANGMVSIGGYPGPCFHHDLARRAGEEFMRRTAEHFATRKNLSAYDVWNEVEIFECWCPATQARYQQQLERVYCTIDALNRAYGRSYAGFSQVRQPKTGVFLEMQDYSEFFHRVQADFMRWRVETLRPVVGKTPLLCHWIGGQPIGWRSDVWLLTDVLDGWGTSTYIGDGDPSLTRSSLLTTCWQFDAIRCSSGEKPWWLSEFTGGRSWSGLGDSLRTDAELQLRVLLALGFGAEAAVFWQWRPEIFGQESPNFGLTGTDGSLTSRTELVGRLAKLIRENQGLFDGLAWKPSSVGLIWEPRGSIYEKSAGGELLLYQHAVGLYRALLDNGYQVDLVNARELAERGVPGHYRLLLSPFQVVDREGLGSRLETWVRDGGVLVAGPNYGVYDALTYANQQSPPPPLNEVFGAVQKQNYFASSPALKWRQGPSVVTLPGASTMETYQLTTAEAVGFYQSKPAATRNRYGNGAAYLLGTYAGKVYDPAKTDALAVILRRVCKAADLEPEVRAGAGCIARVADSSGRKVLFVYNFADRQVLTSVDVAEGRSRGRDLLTGERIRLGALVMPKKSSRLVLLD